MSRGRISRGRGFVRFAVAGLLLVSNAVVHRPRASEVQRVRSQAGWRRRSPAPKSASGLNPVPTCGADDRACDFVRIEKASPRGSKGWIGHRLEIFSPLSLTGSTGPHDPMARLCTKEAAPSSSRRSSFQSLWMISRGRRSARCGRPESTQRRRHGWRSRSTAARASLVAFDRMASRRLQTPSNPTVV